MIGGAMIARVLCNPRIPKGSYTPTQMMIVMIIYDDTRDYDDRKSFVQLGNPQRVLYPTPKWPYTINWVRMVVKSNHGDCDGDGSGVGGNYSQRGKQI